MTSRTFIAIDPGCSGAIAWSDRTGVHVVPMPETRRGCIDAVQEIIKSEAVHGSDGEMIAYMEKVSSYIPGGGASMMFEYGRNVERIGCVLECKGIRIIEIIPRNWQKVLGLGKSERIKATEDMGFIEKKNVTDWNAKAKRDWKNKLKSEAERRFPNQRVTLKTCDALLLLDVAIQLEGNRTPTQQSLIP